jgi:hypothetical protein
MALSAFQLMSEELEESGIDIDSERAGVARLSES